MTNEERKLTGLAMIAHVEGKPVQILDHGSVWLDVSMPTWVAHQPYRPRPEPRVRQWSKPEDVPGPVCWVRAGDKVADAMIIRVHPNGVAMWDTSERSVAMWPWSDIQSSKGEYSTDRKTWHPCTVTEDAQ